MKDNKNNVFLTVLTSFGQSFGIVMIVTILTIMCSVAYAFFNETTLKFPFESFSVIGGDVAGMTGVQIDYHNTLFVLITIIFIVLGILLSGIKILLAQNKKLDKTV
ncbi:MAG: hypothetical protein ACERKZ_20165 [Lachnotalea sp.]